MSSSERFWETRTLSEMSREEWESLCDGCAKCCLHKLEDEDTGEVFFTRVVCRYLDQDKCSCTVYNDRTRLVPDCLKLEPGNFEHLTWLPGTCAYRLLSEGRPLPIWHPLLNGGRKAMENAGQTVSGKVISEEYVHAEGYEDHLVDWVDSTQEE